MASKCVCNFCMKKCKSRAIKLLGNTFYHLECFKCKVCCQQLPLEGFYKIGEDLFCKQDYHKLFGTWCNLCKKLICEQAIVVKNRNFHPECFNCSVCRRSIKPGETANYSLRRILCEECFDKKKVCKNIQIVNNDEQLTGINIKNDAFKKTNDLTTNRENNVTFSPIDLNGSVIYLSASSPYTALNEATPRSRSFQNMPYNKFCNFSYLERSPSDFRKGPASSTTLKKVLHFHRPDKVFTYKCIRADILSEVKKNKEGKTWNSPPIARKNEWFGPPEPAAAYPELIRDRSIDSDGESGAEKEVSEKLVRRMSTLENMLQSSGVARAIWSDIHRQSRNVDPRNASRNPSAINCLPVKLRFECSQNASPSRLANHRELWRQRSACPMPSKYCTLPRFNSLRPSSISYAVKDPAK